MPTKLSDNKEVCQASLPLPFIIVNVPCICYSEMIIVYDYQHS